jgi:hypothetical protein
MFIVPPTPKISAVAKKNVIHRHSRSAHWLLALVSLARLIINIMMDVVAAKKGSKFGFNLWPRKCAECLKFMTGR